MGQQLAIITSITAGVILGILSNWFYEILKAKGFLPEKPTLKRLIVIVSLFIPFLLLVALPTFRDTVSLITGLFIFILVLTGIFIWTTLNSINASDWQRRMSIVLYFINAVFIGITSTIIAQQTTMAELQPKIETLQAITTAQQTTIAELQPKIETLQAITTAQQTTIAELQPKIETLQAIAARSSEIESELITISSRKYPFLPTKIYINEGDFIEVIFLGSDNTWYCIGEEPISPAGTTKFLDNQKSSLSPSINFCGLIGYIGEDGPFLAVGSSPRFVANTSGRLYLGANDTAPDLCGLDDKQQCFLDNRGELKLKITVTRKK